MAGKLPKIDFVDFAQLKDRDRVAATFLVQQKHVLLNKNGKPYIAMVLMNRTGTMDARVWDNVEQLTACFESGDFIEIRGSAVEYQHRIQLKVEWLQRVDPTSLNPEDYLPVSRQDRDEMLNRVRFLASKIGSPSLRKLILGCLDDEVFRNGLVRSPAAKTIHHAYLGGLLEHTLSVMELADRLADTYLHLDRDLLLAGAFFHDIGKIRELEHERSFEYTDEGRLLGHIVMGASMLADLAKAYPGLSDETVLKLTHMILSHHGSLEFGSPKRPKFPEALALNYIDELDSKLQTLREIAEQEEGHKWSSYQRLFDRHLLLGNPTPSVPNSSDKRQSLPASLEKLDETKNSGVSLDLFQGERHRSKA